VFSVTHLPRLLPSWLFIIELFISFRRPFRWSDCLIVRFFLSFPLSPPCVYVEHFPVWAICFLRDLVPRAFDRLPVFCSVSSPSFFCSFSPSFRLVSFFVWLYRHLLWRRALVCPFPFQLCFTAAVMSRPNPIRNVLPQRGNATSASLRFFRSSHTYTCGCDSVSESAIVACACSLFIYSYDFDLQCPVCDRRRVAHASFSMRRQLLLAPNNFK